MGNIAYLLYGYLHCSNVLRGMKVYIDVVRKIRRVYIQGVTGGTDQTSGGCSLC